MRTSLKVAMVVVSVAGAVTLTGVGIGVASASGRSHPASASRHVSAGVVAGKLSVTGWQGTDTYAVPAGLSGLFFHYSCPAKEFALTGSWQLPSATDPSAPLIVFDGSFPRTDLGTANYTQYGWAFSWPGAGAPADSSIIFNVYCTK